MKTYKLIVTLFCFATTAILFSCSEDTPTPSVSLISEWEGDYFVYAEDYDDFFVKLVIDNQGNVKLNGLAITEFTYDEASNTMSFPTLSIGGFFVEGTVVFEQYGENKLFEGELFSNGEIDGHDFKGSINPVVLYEGYYQTETQWWGGFFSPLQIDKSGEVKIADTEIEYNYDNETKNLTFDWHIIKTTTAKGSIILQDADDKYFTGSINPRPQDGPVGYSGTEL